jgi:hypothetical protein
VALSVQQLADDDDAALRGDLRVEREAEPLLVQQRPDRGVEVFPAGVFVGQALGTARVVGVVREV